MRLFSLKPSRRLCDVAFAALAVVVCSAGRAGATCGDYVHVVKDGVQADGSGVPDGPDRPQPPCDGPGCSDRPTTPVLPLTAPVSESGGAKELVTRAAGGGTDHSDSSWHTFPDATGSPVRIPIPIFDPPRAS